MNVNLTPYLEKMVQEKVSKGLCTSASELKREALRLMDKQDTIRQAKTDLLGQEIQAEIGRRTATALNSDEIRKAGREGRDSTSTRL